MRKSHKLKQHTAMFMAVIMSFQLLAGCSGDGASKGTSATLIPENVLNEQFIDELNIEDEKLDESYIIENMVYEDGIYEYKLSENIICQTYIIEIVISETAEQDIKAQLPSEIDDYDIDWPKVIGKFAVGTSIILAVGVVNHFAAGTTFFAFGSPATVTKDALLGAAIGLTLGEVIGSVKDGKVLNKAVKKYAIEGFADGYMWGAISSVLKIFSENVKRLSKFKLATGGTAKIRLDGSVFDDAGKLIGKAYYNKDGTWYLWNEATHVIRAFDVSGKELTGAAIQSLKSLPANSKLRLGTDATAQICYTDDAGQIMRVGNSLAPNISYEINGYTYYTDDLGRISQVVFDDLQLKPDGRTRFEIMDTKNAIGRGFEKTSDDRGHIIADMFNGDNTLANIVSMDGSVNKGDVKAIETIWQNCLQNGGHVNGTIDIGYAGSSFRPDNFNYSYDIGNGLSSVLIPNG